MRRCIAAAVFLGLAVALVSTDAVPAQGKKGKANDGVVTNWGRPTAYSEGKVNAFWVWYENGKWHLRTTGGGKGAHRFQGVIQVVGGKLTGLKGGDGEARGKNADLFVFNAARTEIKFDFKSDQGADGLNFAVDGAATEVRFTLAFDGESSPKHIRIGRDSDHPAGAAFTVPANPANAADPTPKEKGKGKKGKGKD